ncbi:Cation efflux family protein [Paenibacillus sp. GP183]|nr:Cation efflux family protein [Paenibacillus sp. GP183]
MGDTNRSSIVMLAVWISLISNLILTGLKIVVGFLFNSHLLIADGVHNAGDVIATMAALGSAIGILSVTVYYKVRLNFKSSLTGCFFLFRKTNITYRRCLD